MPILADSGTKAIVQGITGKEGSFHTRSMLAYRTKVVAGVIPGKGETRFEGVPVYNSMRSSRPSSHRMRCTRPPRPG